MYSAVFWLSLFRFCHYFLLWIKEPFQALKEMLRVTRPGGYLACFAEPDYGGRLDHPASFDKIREFQISSFENAGADPLMGRKLKDLLTDLGLANIQTGLYQGDFTREPSPEELESEWLVLEHDLKDFLSPQELNDLKAKDRISRADGSRLVYVPTFYGWGMVE